MNGNLLPLFVLFIAAVGFVTAMLLASILLGPKRRSEVKDQPFECGTVGSGDPKDRFGARFFVVAMIFILFDIEIVYFYPWAVNLVKLGWSGFFAMMPFLALLTLGLVYEWKRGVLDW